LVQPACSTTLQRWPLSNAAVQRLLGQDIEGAVAAGNRCLLSKQRWRLLIGKLTSGNKSVAGNPSQQSTNDKMEPKPG
jgi:hypothetical protein